MRIADVAAAVVVDHDAAIEEVELESTILPAFVLAFEVVGEEADEFVDGGGCACLRGGTSYGEGHFEGLHIDILCEVSNLSLQLSPQLAKVKAR